MSTKNPLEYHEDARPVKGVHIEIKKAEAKPKAKAKKAKAKKS